MMLKPLVVSLTGCVIIGAFYVRAQNAATKVEHTKVEQIAKVSPVKVPTFIELGSDRCRSCQAMIPVLDQLRTTHAGGLTVRFIDVWDDPAEGRHYGVKSIPTQILLGADGKELIRHTGFWSIDAIRKAFSDHGYTLAQNQ